MELSGLQRNLEERPMRNQRWDYYHHPSQDLHSLQSSHASQGFCKALCMIYCAKLRVPFAIVLLLKADVDRNVKAVLLDEDPMNILLVAVECSAWPGRAVA